MACNFIPVKSTFQCKEDFSGVGSKFYVFDGSTITNYRITGIDDTIYNSANFVSGVLTQAGTKTITVTIPKDFAYKADDIYYGMALPHKKSFLIGDSATEYFINLNSIFK